MSKPFFAAALLIASVPLSFGADAFPDANARAADIDWLITQIETKYAYLPDRHLDLAKMRALYVPQAKAAATRDDMIHVVERVVFELHDDHVTLGTNTPTSPQLIPTGTDLWAEMRSGRAVIIEVRPDSPAAAAGIRAGDQVVSIGGIPVNPAIDAAKPRALDAPDAEALNFTLRMLLAGTHEKPRRFELKDASGKTRAIELAPFVPPQASELVTSRMLDATTGYIRIENSLGDSDTVAAFDAALDKLDGATNLIFDLRNTPSGGSTDIAEPIMGRFIAKTADYQRIFEPAPGKTFPKDSWLKSVGPREPLVPARLMVLVNHWTGSMGEGMAIGFDAIRGAKVVGTPMARLCGGTDGFALPNTEIPVHIPTYLLYHVNGRPRETWVPAINVDLSGSQAAGDVVLARALAALHRPE